VSAARVVIGVGNRWRGDDGAGLEVARRLEAAAPPGTRVLRHEGDGARLLELWEGARDVVLVDAARSGVAAGTLHRFDACGAPLPAALLRSSTHAFGVAEAIELARALGRLPLRLEVDAIEGVNFAAGEPLSPEVAEAVAALARSLAREP
jgi:hydrogenase maturation protease